MNNKNVAVIIPCYRVTGQILDVLQAIPEDIAHIICVDDHCPDKSGEFVEKHNRDPKVQVVYHDRNKGVGGAMVTGYRVALGLDVEIIIKIDGDGQMDPRLIPDFIAPILSGIADYTKGNRFYNLENLRGMPKIRLFGNGILSFATKVSTGYWSLFDPTNGYTAIHRDALEQLSLEKLSKRYFFESDILFRLGLIRAVVVDVPMAAKYGEEKSNLRVRSILMPFLRGHLKNFTKRILYRYFLYDFNIGSLELVTGFLLFGFGVIFGANAWINSILTDSTATAGTVMVAALPILIGIQMLISFLNYDISTGPIHPLQRLRAKDRPALSPPDKSN